MHDELIAQARALRGLASALVGDGHADDLVQDAAVQALQAKAAPGSMRAWLGRVLRHLAGKHHRSERRRRAHEPRVEPVAAPPPPDRLAEHRDLLLRVTHALVALPEPYQRTLLLRYFEDLPPAAIAARTGEALATVKSRLQRGLALLRERLDRDGGGGQWRSAFVSAFGLERVAVVGSGAVVATTGALVMGTGVKVAGGGTAAVLAVAALWWFTSGEPAPIPAAEATRTAQASPVVSAVPGDALAGERRDVAPDRVAADPASPADTVVRGRCVDEQGQPLAGCLVALQGKLRAGRGDDFVPGLGAWLVDHPGFRWHEPQVVTGGDGVFTFPFAWAPLHFEVGLRRTEEAVTITAGPGPVPRGETRDLGDIVLPVTCVLRCQVTDADGLAIHLPSINLLLESKPAAPWPPNGLCQVPMQRDGTYGAAVLPGKYRVNVFGRTVASGEVFVIPAGATSFDATVVVAAVDPALTITGTITDERERLLSGIVIYGLGTEAGWSRTDHAGAFVLARAPDDKTPATELVVWHDGWMPWSSGTKVRWGSRDQRIVLQPALALEVHVTAAADGRPVEDFSLHVRKQRGNPIQYPDDTVPDGTADHHENGIAQLTRLGPGEHVLVVAPVRNDLASSLAVPFTMSPVLPNRVDVALASAARRLLRVQMPDGAPAAGVGVELIDPMGQAVTTMSPAMAYVDWDPASPRSLRLDRGRTDWRGELPLHGPAGRLHALRLTSKGLPVLVVHDVALDVPEPLVVTLTRGARLEGTLAPPELVRDLLAVKGDAAAVAPGARERPGFRLVRGKGVAREFFAKRLEQPAAQVAADGTFAIDGAPAGTWQLALEPWSFDRPGRRGNAVPVATVELHDGQTTKVVLDLPDWLPVAVDGQVLWNGAPLAEQDAMLFVRWRDAVGGPQMRMERVRTDRDGRFAVRTRPGSAIVTITRSRADGWASLASAPDVLIGPGGIGNASFAIDSGALRLRLLGDDGKPVAGVPLVLIRDEAFEGAWARVRTAPSDADGWIECEGDPRPLLVQVLPQRLLTTPAQNELLADTPEGSTDSLRAHRLTIGTVLPRRGETTTVELRLPPEWFR